MLRATPDRKPTETKEALEKPLTGGEHDTAKTHASLMRTSAEHRPGPSRGTSWREVGDAQPAVTRAEEAKGNAEGGDGNESDNSDDREIRIKDLDSGREYNIRKKYTIRDLNTGQLFVLSKDPSLDPDSPEGAADPQQVTDFASGKQLSLEEFDLALGLGSRGRQGRRGKGAAENGGEETSGSETETTGNGSNVEGIGSGSNGAAAAKKSWLKRIPFRRKGKAVAAEAEDSESEASYAMEGGTSLGRQSAGASPSGRGMPVKVHVHRKLYKDLTGLHSVQELHAHQGVVWTMKFSKNGRFLATAGQDTVVCVWEVMQDRVEQSGQDGEDAQPSPSGGGKSPAGSPTRGEADTLVFHPTPHRTYKGHKQDVLDVAWSKSHFLLTASMDKTVRLWHISMDDCLRVFKHTDFVTALDFHPVDDKYFLSGSIDGKVRIWNIPEQNGRVVDWADVHEMVTATTFSSDGTRAIVGTMKGKCRFYQCDAAFKLEYEAQIDVKNRRGKASRGRKITGVQFVPGDPTKLLITSNDSRIRLYDGYTLRCKYKGHHNSNTQIRASFSEGGDFIVCGSDDGSVYFWNTGGGASMPSSARLQNGPQQEKSGSYECFRAHDDIVTVAIFAPNAARRPLQRRSPYISAKLGAADSVNRLGLRGKLSKEEAAEAVAAGELAVASAKACGQVILTAGYSGEIKVFENMAPPHWL